MKTIHISDATNRLLNEVANVITHVDRRAKRTPLAG